MPRSGKRKQGEGQVLKGPSPEPKQTIQIGSVNTKTLLVDCEINGTQVKAIVDCGSPICLLSDSIFRKMGVTGELDEVQTKIVGAEGSQLEIRGSMILDLTIQGVIAKQLFFICNNLKQRALIGLDFLRDQGCTLDFSSGTLCVGKNKIKLADEPCGGVQRVSMPETITLQPGRKVDVKCKVKNADSEGTQGVLEPLAAFHERFPVAVPCAVSYVSGGSTPVRFYNYSCKPVVIYKGTSVGEFCPTAGEGETLVTARCYRIESHKEGQGTEKMECNSLTCEVDSDDHNVVEEMKLFFPIENDELSEEQKLKVWKIFAKHSQAVSRGPQDIGHCVGAQLRINTGSAPPTKLPLRRYSPEQERFICEETQKLLNGDVIEPSTSPWSAQVVLASKKDGTYRFCLDFRKLNLVTVKEHFPIPKIEDMIDALAGAKYFSTLDLISAYHAFEIHPTDREKTAFSTKQGHWQWKRVPFGLCNAAPFFVRQIASLLTGMTWIELLAFFDDVLVFSPTFEKHCSSLDRTLSLIEQAGLKVKPAKCHILPTSIPFVGHMLSSQGVSADPEKVSVVRTWPPPTNLSELRAFVGKVGYYRKFIPNFASVASPLFKLEEKGKKFVWSQECQKSFEKLKEALCEAPVLAFPNFDLPFILDTDASTTGIAAVLSQVQDGTERPIAYAAKSLNKSQRKWPTTKIEMLALKFGTETFYPYLINRKFTARLDHRSLVWLHNFKNPRPQEARWIEYLQQFDMEIEHRPGHLHCNADGLSRRPWPGAVCEQTENTEPEDNFVRVISATSTKVGTIGSEDTTTQYTIKGWWSDNHLKEKQAKDWHLSKVLCWLAKGEKPTRGKMQGADRQTWSLWSQFGRFVLSNGLLYREWTKKKTGRVSRQLCIPYDLRAEVLRELHDHCGHLSTQKTLEQVRKRFYWFDHARDIEIYCRSCHTCGSRNGPIPRPRAPMVSIKSGYPLERIQIDILGPLPETDVGNKYVAVVVDTYTKWPEAYALENQEAETVAQVVVDNFICRFGCPVGVLSDQGRNFESKVFRGLCNMIESAKQRTTPYHPQCDGGAERLIRTITNIVAKLAEEHKQWDEYLPKVLMSLRASVHETTGFSPSMLMFGRELRLPLDTLRGEPPFVQPADYPAYIARQREILRETAQIAEENRQKKLVHQKDVYDARCRDNISPYRVGDLVWLEEKAVPKGLCRKFHKPWTGPWKVVKVISDITYRIQREGAKSAYQRQQMRVVVHFNRLKPYILRPQDLEALSSEEQSHVDGNDCESCSDGGGSEMDETADLVEGTDDLSLGESSGPDNISVNEDPTEDSVSGETTNATPLPQRTRRTMRRRRAPTWITSGDYVV